MLRLHFNENLYGLAPELQPAIREVIDAVNLALYPDGGGTKLRAALSGYTGVSRDRLVLGNGSDELIFMVLLAYRSDIEQVIIPVPTFGEYRKAADSLGLRVVEIPLDDGFELDVPAILDTISGVESAVFLCLPNNPTGNYFKAADVEAIIASDARLLIIDEAYFEFGGRTYIDATDRDARIAVLRTLSKAFALAGQRIGYLAGHQEMARRVDEIRQPFNVGALSQEIATLVVDNAPVQLASVPEIMKERETLQGRLGSIPGLTPLPSVTNFFLLQVDEKFARGAEEVQSVLLQKGIRVRFLPDLPDYIRVSAGTPEAGVKLVEVMQAMYRGEI